MIALFLSLSSLCVCLTAIFPPLLTIALFPFFSFPFFFALLHNIKSFRPTSWMLWASGGALDQYARIWISLSLSAVQELAGELVYSTTNIYIRFSSAGNYHILLFFFSIFYIILYILSLPRKKKLSYDSIFSFHVSISTLNGVRLALQRAHKRQYIFFPPPIFFHVPFSLLFLSLRLLEMYIRSGASRRINHQAF